jgi:hypothetical protein
MHFAVSWTVAPFGIEVIVGANEESIGPTTIEVSVAGFTVTVVEPVTAVEPDPKVASMAAVPVVWPVWPVLTSPWVGKKLLTNATVGVFEIQSTCVVRTWVLPSLKKPMAVICSVSPAGIEGLAGTTAIDFSAASVTVTVAVPGEPELLEVAVMVVALLPTAMAVTSPWELTCALALLLDCQPTPFVQSWVLRSL